jgi:hypothetical protein
MRAQPRAKSKTTARRGHDATAREPVALQARFLSAIENAGWEAQRYSLDRASVSQATVAGSAGLFIWETGYNPTLLEPSGSVGKASPEALDPPSSRHFVAPQE